MKPNFALSLSFEGIRLLHRAAGGWRRVGDVAVTSDDLTADLTNLRTDAERLDKAPLRTKLIIPDDQIKYLSIETGFVDTATRRDAARTALDGASPYAVDALVFDICEDGGTTHIAAVARETLAEAEAFASEHKFHPMCFVAAPDDQAFLGEPWFGPSAHASAVLTIGDTVEADGVRVVVIGDATVPPMPAEAEDAPDADIADPSVATPEAEIAATPDLPDTNLHFEPLDEDDLPDAPEDAEDTLTAPTLGFASRRSGTAIPLALGGVTRDASDLTSPPKTIVHKPCKAPLTPSAGGVSGAQAGQGTADPACRRCRKPHRCTHRSPTRGTIPTRSPGRVPVSSKRATATCPGQRIRCRSATDDDLWRARWRAS